MIPPGRDKLDAKPSLTGAATTTKTIGTDAPADAARIGGGGRIPVDDDEVRAPAGEFRREKRQPGERAAGVAGFDQEVATLGVAEIEQALAEGGEVALLDGGGAQEAEPKNPLRRALRPRRRGRQRP
jgi:hypothetical protein